MFTVERAVGNYWEFYAECKLLEDAIFSTEEAFMQDHLNDEFHVYRVVDADGETVFTSS